MLERNSYLRATIDAPKGAGKGNTMNTMKRLKIAGVDKPFGQSIDAIRKISTALQDSINCKHKKSVITCINNWIKDVQPSEYFCEWIPKSEYYSDDSITVPAPL